MGLIARIAARWRATVEAANNASKTPDVEESASERLEKAFGEFRVGEITLEEYREMILREQADIRDMVEAIRIDRRTMGREWYENEKEKLDDDREEVRWRLEWVNRQIASGAGQNLRGSGRWARFEYVDQYGEVTKREITNWDASGRYIRGYDRMRKEERTFRQDRISDWQAG